MKVAVVGGGTCNTYKLLEKTLNAIPNIEVIIYCADDIISKMVERYANLKVIPTITYYPNWSDTQHAGHKGTRKHGFHCRNKSIVENADIFVTF